MVGIATSEWRSVYTSLEDLLASVLVEVTEVDYVYGFFHPSAEPSRLTIQDLDLIIVDRFAQSY